MWSPNSNNRGSYVCCVVGRQYVRWIGDQWLDTTPTPVGPLECSVNGAAMVDVSNLPGN